MKSTPESSTQEVLAGLVERVTFHNAENGFCVLRAKARGHRDLVTVVGHAAVTGWPPNWDGGRHAPPRHDELAFAICSVANDWRELIGENTREQEQIAGLDSGQAKRNRTATLQLLKRIPDLGIIGPLASSCNTALTVGRKREAHSCLPSMALRG
jgi:hypothetical protein